MNEDDDNEIMRDILAFRAAFAAAHNHDVYAMGETLDRLTVENGWKTVTPLPRPAVPPVVATPPAAAGPAPDAPRSTPASSA